jgi:CO/xanthine dehydrogenase FAD-binding subunit
MKLRLSAPAMLIDIARLPGLSGIEDGDVREFHQRASRCALIGVACVLEMDGAFCRAARLGVNGLASRRTA